MSEHTPESLFECEQCWGEGVIRRGIWVYEAGCGFGHDDVEELPCQTCNGAGFFIAEARADVGQPVGRDK